MAKYSVLVSIAIAQADSLEVERAVHLLTFEDLPLSEEEVVLLVTGMVGSICQIVHKESGKQVFGLYEEPGEGVTVQ